MLFKRSIAANRRMHGAHVIRLSELKFEIVS